MFKIPVYKLNELFSVIAKDKELYLPLNVNGELKFDKWASDAKVDFDKITTDRSSKDLFFPQSENLMGFKLKDKEIELIDKREEIKPFVVFGVRACDAKSFEILDTVFLSEPVDTYYKAKRDNGTVVTMACFNPNDTCFCNVFGIEATNPGGDAVTFIVEDTLYLKGITEKGLELIERCKEVLQSTDENDVSSLDKAIVASKEETVALPFASLSLEGINGDHLNEIFDLPLWSRLSEACIGCGTCTYICPTCQCYDIKDYDTGHGVIRYRCWDSCMYSDFTRMSAGNPRPTQVERFRQRFMHKLVYYPANNDGVYGCVGCGRCLQKCPVSMNIVKVIKALGVSKNE